MNIFNEDCLQGMAKLPDKYIDFICADLPFGVMSYKQDKQVDLAEMWQQFKRILKPCAVVALFAAGKFTFTLAESNFEWYKYKFIWVKNFSTLFIHAKNRPLAKYEEILIFSGGTIQHASLSGNRMKYFPQGVKSCDIVKANGNGTVSLKGGKHSGDARKKFGGVYHTCPSNQAKLYREQLETGYPTDVLYFAAPYNGKRYHPNQKPTPLLEYLIKTYSQEGETVLDCTMGSGSTGVACVNTNREFIGYELDEGYFGVAKARIEKALREKAQRLF